MPFKQLRSRGRQAHCQLPLKEAAQPVCCRGACAAFEMVKIYLHPEIEAMWADSGSAGPRTPTADAAAAAQKLLADVRVTDRTATQHQVGSWA